MRNRQQAKPESRRRCFTGNSFFESSEVESSSDGSSRGIPVPWNWKRPSYCCQNVDAILRTTDACEKRKIDHAESAWPSFDVGLLSKHLEEVGIKPGDQGNTPLSGIASCYPIFPMFSSQQGSLGSNFFSNVFWRGFLGVLRLCRHLGIFQPYDDSQSRGDSPQLEE